MVSKATFWSVVVGLFIIVVGNIIATEYRLKRERKEAEKNISKNGFICPACPACGPQTQNA